MFTKILFYDDDGDLMMDYAQSAYFYEDHEGTRGIAVDITAGYGIFIPNQGEAFIKALFHEDRVDLTSFGNVVWKLEDGSLSSDPDYNKDDEDEDDESEEEE